MSDSETLILVIGMFVFVIGLLFLIYRFFLKPGFSPAASLQDTPAARAPAPSGPAMRDTRTAQKSAVQAAADTLAAEIQAGYVQIVAKTKCLQDQIQLLYTIRNSIDPARHLEKDKATKFAENTKNLDRLADRYIVVYHELRILLENEYMIRSPDLLQYHRKKEFEKIQQLSALSKEIQPLLNENEDIVAPFIGFTR